MRRAGGLPEHGHTIRVSAEGRDIFLHPSQCKNHVTDGEIGRHSGNFHKAVNIDPVIDAYQDDPVPRE